MWENKQNEIMRKSVFVLFLSINLGWITQPLVYGQQPTGKNKNQKTSVKSSPREAKLTPIEAPLGLGMTRKPLLADSSRIAWEADQQTIKQTGLFKLSRGTLFLNGQALGAGEIILDMKGVHCTTFEDSIKNKEITEWLKSPLFFDSGKYPFAQIIFDRAIQINSGEYILVSKITLRGKTVESTFPISVRKERGMTILYGKVTFDRTFWGLTAGSLRYYPNLTENIFSEEIGIEMELKFAL